MKKYDQKCAVQKDRNIVFMLARFGRFLSASIDDSGKRAALVFGQESAFVHFRIVLRPCFSNLTRMNTTKHIIIVPNHDVALFLAIANRQLAGVGYRFEIPNMHSACLLAPIVKNDLVESQLSRIVIKVIDLD